MLLRLRPISLPNGILIYPAIWPQQIWGENWGEAPPPFGQGSWVPIEHNVARAEAYLHAKFHLGPIVWPQYTNVTDRIDRQDRQRPDSIGRTVLQTVAQQIDHAQRKRFVGEF